MLWNTITILTILGLTAGLPLSSASAHEIGSASLFSGIEAPPPAPGALVSQPPESYELVPINGRVVLYSAGVFYRAGSDGYRVIVAPVGACVADLPLEAATILIDGTIHRFYHGVFYTWDRDYGVYEVVPAPQGAVVARLPERSKYVDVEGAGYFEFAGTAYRPDYRDGRIAYVVANR